MSETIKVVKKKSSFLTKIIIIFAIVFAGYVGLRYWKFKAIQRLNSQTETSKFNSIESEIFDLSSDDKNHDDTFDDSKLSDITLTELKEGGAEFIYQLLLKNQVQIGDLKTDIQSLKTEFAKYKSQEKAGKIIFTYVDLRQRFYAGQPFSETLKGLETLAVLDKNLQSKITLLKQNLDKFHGSKILLQNFTKLIPDLIAAKTNDPNSSLIKKIRHNLSKLVVIRKLDSNTQSVDGIIRTTEEFLQNEDFISALDSFILLEQNYQELSLEFLETLKSAAAIQKIDQEILLYLRGSI
ncbi:MAG: hypothetical protein EXR06_02350 [Rickettsiales bacterium]|nr:hypothetical protein [Rickettsiales bacterium]